MFVIIIIHEPVKQRKVSEEGTQVSMAASYEHRKDHLLHQYHWQAALFKP
jgi:hypothetical protein